MKKERKNLLISNEVSNINTNHIGFSKWSDRKKTFTNVCFTYEQVGWCAY
jgi:hypothetical protein